MTGPKLGYIRSELLALVEEDQRVRAELVAEGSLFDGYHPRMRVVHEANAERLASILNQRGWPGEPRVGSDGANAAWLIVHAIGRPAFQREALEVLRLAAARARCPRCSRHCWRIGSAPWRGASSATARSSTGTNQASSARCPSRIPDGVDERRRAIGTRDPSHNPSARNARLAAAEDKRPPGDWHARRHGTEEWLREVGWRR